MVVVQLPLAEKPEDAQSLTPSPYCLALVPLPSQAPLLYRTALTTETS